VRGGIQYSETLSDSRGFWDRLYCGDGGPAGTFRACDTPPATYAVYWHRRGGIQVGRIGRSLPPHRNQPPSVGSASIGGRLWNRPHPTRVLRARRLEDAEIKPAGRKPKMGSGRCPLHECLSFPMEEGSTPFVYAAPGSRQTRLGDLVGSRPASRDCLFYHPVFSWVNSAGLPYAFVNNKEKTGEW